MKYDLTATTQFIGTNQTAIELLMVIILPYNRFLEAWCAQLRLHSGTLEVYHWWLLDQVGPRCHLQHETPLSLWEGRIHPGKEVFHDFGLYLSLIIKLKALYCVEKDEVAHPAMLVQSLLWSSLFARSQGFGELLSNKGPTSPLSIQQKQQVLVNSA
jgi:hypothetical protein